MIYVLGGRVYAAIGVTYPAGSICSCTKGGVTRRAGDTSGRWVFPVSGTGTYTISCTNGTETATKTVSITAKGQCAVVALEYGTFLYNRGDECSSLTGGWAGYTYTSSSGDGGGSYTKGADKMTIQKPVYGAGWALGTVNMINTTGKSRITFSGEYFNSSTGIARLCLSTNKVAETASSTIAAQVEIGSSGSATLSNIPQGSYYLNIRDTKTYPVNLYVYEIKLF